MDAGEFGEGLFHLDRRDAEPARVHHIVIAPQIGDLPIGAHDTLITGQEPVPLIFLGRLIRRAKIAEHQPRVALVDRDGAFLADLYRAFRPDQRDATPVLRLAQCAGPRRTVGRGGEEGRTLRHTVGLEDRRAAGSLPRAGNGRGQLFPRAQPVAQAWHVDPVVVFQDLTVHPRRGCKKARLMPRHQGR